MSVPLDEHMRTVCAQDKLDSSRWTAEMSSLFPLKSNRNHPDSFCVVIKSFSQYCYLSGPCIYIYSQIFYKLNKKNINTGLIKILKVLLVSWSHSDRLNTVLRKSTNCSVVCFQYDTLFTEWVWVGGRLFLSCLVCVTVKVFLSYPRPR